MSDDNQRQGTTLVRCIGVPLLTFYGLGTILGAGIYVLVGKVAAVAGLLAPLAFLVSAVVAALTALSYSQLVICYPRSAGEAYYVEQGFRHPVNSLVVGYLVIFTGIVSSATLANGFVGYLSSFIEVPRGAGITGVVLLMGALAIWGIAESLWLAAVITVVEIAGLFVVIFFGGASLAQQPVSFASLFVPTSGAALGSVVGGAFLAFYAFIGFEDMVNVVEEVKDPRRTMPRAIVLALVISTLLYLLVALVCVVGLPLPELSASEAPLKDLLMNDYPVAGVGIGLISLFAIINGVLIQIIMGSRVLYGMADQGRAPSSLARVSPFTRTPVLATLVVTGVTLLFALWLPLVVLAKTTSFIILMIFTWVNLALWRLRRRGEIPADRHLPAWPIIGAVLCLGLLFFQTYELTT